MKTRPWAMAARAVLGPALALALMPGAPLAFGALAPLVASAATPTAVAVPRTGSSRPAPAAARLVRWVLETRDHGGRPFAVIDKPAARLYVHDAEGRLLGEAPVLLGLARGDHTVPGIGDRPIAQVKPHERTTPAGRFVTARGRNADGKQVVWIDYDAAVSMHAVIAGEPGESRFERITSSNPARRRISFGCVNVPGPFFEHTVLSAFATRGGIVYVMPDRGPLEKVFPGLAQRSKGPADAARAATP